VVKEVCQEYPLQLTSKGLFLIDLNVLAANTAHPAGMKPAEAHVAKTSQPKFNVPSPEILSSQHVFHESQCSDVSSKEHLAGSCDQGVQVSVGLQCSSKSSRSV